MVCEQGRGGKKRGGGGRKELFEGNVRTNGGTWNLGNLDHVMFVGCLHGITPLDNDVSPRRTKDDVTIHEVTCGIIGRGRHWSYVAEPEKCEEG